MSQQVDGNFKSFVGAAATGMYVLVRKHLGKAHVATASHIPTGSNTRASFAADEELTVKLRSAAGTHKLIAGGVIADGAEIFAAADGKVAASGTISLGTALEAAAADGDIIECLIS
jgi:hypothetical protein